MNKLIVTAAALSALVGCKGGLSNADLAKVIDANGQVSSGAYTSASSNGAARDATDFSWAGTVTGSGTWSGTVDVNATGTADDNGNATWTLDLTYTDVTYDNYTLNGDVTETAAVASGGGGVDVTYTLSGDLAVTGDAEGDATFDYTAAVSVGQTGYSYSYTGTINGKDVESVAGSGSR